MTDEIHNLFRRIKQILQVIVCFAIMMTISDNF